MISGVFLCFAALMNFTVGGFWLLVGGFALVIWLLSWVFLLYRGGVSWFGFSVVLCWCFPVALDVQGCGVPF